MVLRRIRESISLEVRINRCRLWSPGPWNVCRLCKCFWRLEDGSIDLKFEVKTSQTTVDGELKSCNGSRRYQIEVPFF
jgi:hypothetical protein